MRSPQPSLLFKQPRQTLRLQSKVLVQLQVRVQVGVDFQVASIWRSSTETTPDPRRIIPVGSKQQARSRVLTQRLSGLFLRNQWSARRRTRLLKPRCISGWRLHSALRVGPATSLRTSQWRPKSLASSQRIRPQPSVQLGLATLS